MSTGGHPGERLSAYMDGELPPSERTEVEAHLRECAGCRQRLDDLLAVDASARALEVQAPEGYFDAFPERVRARLSARRRPRVPVWTWAAAAALLLAVLTPLTLRERSAAPALSSPAVPAEGGQPPATAPALSRDQAPSPTALPERAESRGHAVEGGPPPATASGSERKVRQEPVSERLRAREAAKPAPAGDRFADQKKNKDKEEEDAGTAGEGRTVANAPARRADEQRRAEVAGRVEPQSAPAAAAEAPAAEAPATPAAQVGMLKSTASPSASPLATGGTASNGARLGGDEFEALASRRVRTAPQARAAAQAWRAYAERHPQGPPADEARVRAIEWLATAWRLGREAADRDQARALAQVYLAGDGARKDRVRAVLEQLGP